MKISTIVPKKAISTIPDRLFIYLQYYQSKKKFLNIRNPKTYSEKMQWIKIHGHLERYAKFADKYDVRDYIERTVGEKYLIPIYGHWDNFDDVPFEVFPNKFVLKATHGSGYNFVCTNKSKVDMTALRHEANRWMNENFYIFHREKQYKKLKPKLICEKYLEDETGELRDYKFTCSNGHIDFIEIHSNRSKNHTVQLTDGEWNVLPYETIAATPVHPLPKPKNYSEIVEVVQKLSHDFSFVRVDLYLVSERIYFGELTFTPGDGTFPFIGQSDYKVGQLIDLSGFKK